MSHTIFTFVKFCYLVFCYLVSNLTKNTKLGNQRHQIAKYSNRIHPINPPYVSCGATSGHTAAHLNIEPVCYSELHCFNVNQFYLLFCTFQILKLLNLICFLYLVQFYHLIKTISFEIFLQNILNEYPI